MERDPIVLGQNYILPGSDIGVTRPNGNALIVGATGVGKSTSVLIPTLAHSHHSNPVLTYSKEVDGYKMASYLKRKGYTVHILNISHADKSTISFDPMQSIESFEDIDALSAAIVNAAIQNSNDDYWRNKAKALAGALIAAAMMISDKNSDPGMTDMLSLFDKLLPVEQGNTIGTQLDSIFSKIEKASPGCYALREYNAWRSLPYNTASCVRDTLSSALSAVFPEAVRKLMRSKARFDHKRFAENKEALIVITSAVDTSQQYYANLFYRDLIRQLIRYSEECPNGELPREIRLYFDDFACTCPIEGFAQDISMFRSAGLSAVLLLQSESQLESIYKEDAKCIRQNCAVYAYFPGGFDDRSCEIVSKRMGLPYEEILYAPLGKLFIMQSGRKPVHIPRYDTLNSKEYADYINNLSAEEMDKTHGKQIAAK